MKNMGVVTDRSYWEALREQGKDPLEELRTNRPAIIDLLEMANLRRLQGMRVYSDEIPLPDTLTLEYFKTPSIYFLHKEEMRRRKRLVDSLWDKYKKIENSQR